MFYVCSCSESKKFIVGFANVVPAECFSAEFVRLEAPDAEETERLGVKESSLLEEEEEACIWSRGSVFVDRALEALEVLQASKQCG